MHPRPEGRGFTHWLDKNQTGNNTLTAKEQITQLFLISEGLSSGHTFNSIFSVLAEQTRPDLKKGWSNVKVSEDIKIVNALVQTNFFSEDVLTIFKMISLTENFEKGVNTAIKYLMMDLSNH